MTTDLDGTGWRKSSYSGSQAGNCVEVAVGQELVGVRDSKYPGVVLSFEAGEWHRFLHNFAHRNVGSRSWGCSG